MTIGQPILREEEFGQRVPSDAVDPEQAIHLVLQAYLLGLSFFANGRVGPVDAPSRSFKLADVFHAWPEPNVELPYPCASIDAALSIVERHSLTPTVVEGSFGRYGDGTALWKLGELVADVQVDFWANNEADREGMIARLPGAFAPGEDANRVLLTGTPVYWCLPVRAQLLDYKRIDTEEAILSNEWRALTRVRASVEVVELRCATLLSVRTHVTAEEMAAIAESGD